MYANSLAFQIPIQVVGKLLCCITPLRLLRNAKSTMLSRSLRMTCLSRDGATSPAAAI